MRDKDCQTYKIYARQICGKFNGHEYPRKTVQT